MCIYCVFWYQFTRQGFENASWIARLDVFSKLSLLNFISKDANLVFYLSDNQVDSPFKLAIIT